MVKELPYFVQHNAFEAVDLGEEGIVYDRLNITPTEDPLGLMTTVLPHFAGRIQNPQSGRVEVFDLLDMPDLPVVLASPSKFAPDSPDCEAQAHSMEELHHDLLGEAIVVEFGLQPATTLGKFAKEHELEHPLVSVTRGMARKMGAQIAPALNKDGSPAADTAFWTNHTTARSIVVATSRDLFGDRLVLHRQREADQGASLNLFAVKQALRHAPQMPH